MRGITLIEVMIVVVIIAILASIAYPSYTQYIMQSRRSDAMTVLLEMQSRQESWRINNPAYASLADLGTLPANNFYTFAVTSNTATAYTLTATAVAGTTQARDTGCTTLSLDQQGQRLPAECWRK